MITDNVEIGNDAEINIATEQLKIKDSTEKRNWFLSLSSRRRKMRSQQNSSSSSSSISELSQQQQQSNLNNGNESITTSAMNSDQMNLQTFVKDQRKRKDEKNVFQRIKKKIGIQFLLRQKKIFATATADSSGSGSSNNSNDENISDVLLQQSQQQFVCACMNVDPIPFSYQFRKYVTKKWLEYDTGPNRVEMYKACYEMLSQVWYWGEISRRDAQKQLTDKPTGSFLVRDSETSGSQFTLSFRIANVTLHYRLEYRNNYWHFEEFQYESIVGMIDDILYRCTNDNFVCFVKVHNEMQPPLPVILKYPLSRYFRLPKLQDLCRRVIQRNIELAEISSLPLPAKLQSYLMERRGLVFQS